MKLVQAAKRLLRWGEESCGPKQTDLVYWKQRVRQFGGRSVLNLTHGPCEYESVTRMQCETLLPLFRALLNGSERIVLDFGCGPGRFTALLADLTGYCIGMDPMVPLLEMAPSAPRVAYVANPEGIIPLRSDAVDAVWCCLVLGGIQNGALTHTVTEIERVLSAKGLLYLVESTGERPDGPHWRFRSAEQYMALFPKFQLQCIGGYHDAGDQISILAGRKG